MKIVGDDCSIALMCCGDEDTTPKTDEASILYMKSSLIRFGERRETDR